MTTAGEEAAAIAQEFIVSLDNVPSEVQFLLAEMRERECRITELQARIQPRSAQYLRHAGKGMLTDKDTQSYERINADYELINTLSQEKVQMAKKLHNLLVKHSNRLQVELAKITNPGEISRPIYPTAIASSNYGVATTPVAISSLPQPEPLVYSGASRTPITGVVQALKADASTSSVTSATSVPPAPVPIVLEPSSNTVSAAPSPSGGPASKRRKLNPSQSTTSIQPAAAPSTPSAGTPRPSAPRPVSTVASLTPAAPVAPETPSTRTRRAASANVSPAPNPATSRNVSESTSMSTTTTGEDDKDDVMGERSSTGEGDGDADGDDGPYCVCQEKSYGEMIGCDNGTDCPYQWFHVACVHVQKPLPNTWFCDYCTKKLGFADNTGAQASGSERPARKRRR